jgi:hypothetical protein
MIIEKSIETRLDIEDSNTILTTDFQKVYIDLLNKKYKGRCFKSIFILDVLDILYSSEIRYRNKDITGYMYVDLVFLVRGLLYVRNEILFDCEIIKIDIPVLSDSTIKINAKSEYASIIISNNTPYDMYSVGQKVPVVVRDTRYYNFKDYISVSAIPFQPYKIPSVDYLTNGDINYKILYMPCEDETIEYNSSKISKITDIQKALGSSKINKASKFFARLIFDPNIKPITGSRLISLSSKRIDFKRSELFYILEGKMYTMARPRTAENKNIKIISLPAMEIYNKLLSELYIDLVNIKGLAENYDTPEKIKNGKVIWKLYSTIKSQQSS